MEPNGNFPGHSPEPTEETLTDLKKVVRDEKADFGVGYDGDGDRSVFIDDKGQMVPADITLTVPKTKIPKSLGKSTQSHLGKLIRELINLSSKPAS